MRVRINWYLACVMLICLITVSITFFSMYFYDVDNEIEIVDYKPKPKKLKVMLLVEGLYNDHGWSQSHVDSFHTAISQIGVIGEIHDSVSDADCFNYIKYFVEQGGDVVIAPSWRYDECINKATKTYPTVKFLAIINPKLKPEPNLLTFYAHAYQVRYLTGIIAAHVSESDNFAYISSVKSPETVRGVNAYALGVRSVNPNAKIRLINLNTWDTDNLETSALKQLQEKYPDIEIVSNHISAKYIDLYCEVNGLKCISYSSSKSNLYPLSNLTAVEWDWSSFYKATLSSIRNNTFTSGNFNLSLRYDVVTLGNINPIVTYNAISQAESEMTALLKQTKDVFEGPIYDNQGKLRVHIGKTVSEHELINEMLWYVEGVEEVPYAGK